MGSGCRIRQSGRWFAHVCATSDKVGPSTAILPMRAMNLVTERKPNRPLIAARLAVILLVFGPLLAGCDQGQQQAGSPPPTVTVTKPIKRTIVDQDEYVGRFFAIRAVEALAR